MGGWEAGVPGEQVLDSHGQSSSVVFLYIYKSKYWVS